LSLINDTCQVPIATTCIRRKYLPVEKKTHTMYIAHTSQNYDSKYYKLKTYATPYYLTVCVNYGYLVNRT